MNEFVQWLASTSLSNALASELWVVPAVQSAHILAIGVIFGSLLIVGLRVLGWAASDQTMHQVSDRFAPWIWGALAVLAMSGALLITIEPARELLSVSFWLKMAMLAIGSAFVLALQLNLRRHSEGWESEFGNRGSTRVLAVVAFVVWTSVIVLGRLIAWDTQIWGAAMPPSVS
jgi:putative copper export protein